MWKLIVKQVTISTFRQWEVVADEDHEMPACQDAISDVDPAKWSIGDIRELEVAFN